MASYYSLHWGDRISTSTRIGKSSEATAETNHESIPLRHYVRWRRLLPVPVASKVNEFWLWREEDIITSDRHTLVSTYPQLANSAHQNSCLYKWTSMVRSTSHESKHLILTVSHLARSLKSPCWPYPTLLVSLTKTIRMNRILFTTPVLTTTLTLFNARNQPNSPRKMTVVPIHQPHQPFSSWNQHWVPSACAKCPAASITYRTVCYATTIVKTVIRTVQRPNAENAKPLNDNPCHMSCSRNEESPQTPEKDAECTVWTLHSTDFDKLFHQSEMTENYLNLKLYKWPKVIYWL